MIARSCRCLRTKADYLPPPDPERPDPGAAASYWCARTLDCVGPDGGPVTPRECDRARTCHEPMPPEPAADAGKIA